MGVDASDNPFETGRFAFTRGPICYIISPTLIG